MAASTSAAMPTAVGPETPIRIKVTAAGVTYKTKLPLSDLVPTTLPGKLRTLIGVSDSQTCVFERFSDSSNSFVDLDPSNVQAYKTLFRAARAKLRLNLRATVCNQNPEQLTDFNKSLIDFSKLSLGSTSTLASTLVSQPESSGTSITAVPESTETSAAVPTLAPSPAFPRKVTIVNIEEPAEKVEASPEPIMETPKSPESETEKTPSSPKSESPRRYPTFTHYSPTTAVRSTGISAPMLNATYSWSVYCNNCDKNMLNEHYHCNICDEGDYDLCVECKNQGVHCRGEDHWLIKRFLDARGTVISSTTETVGPRSKETPITMPGAFTEEKKIEEYEAPSRTCNSCIKAFTEEAFVTCLHCEDYDLCVPCLRRGKHGHHPAHEFKPVNEATILSKPLQDACKPGRDQKHHAICDLCDKSITGVRHKCLNCPDWDYCSDCVGQANKVHPGHRFAKLYEPISFFSVNAGPVHHNIRCDGPLCKFKSQYIKGIRYKCVVCADVDFCANCEASPHNAHNKTHPLLKLRTPVRGCNIETVIEEHDIPRHIRAMAAASAITNSATQIRTVVDMKPTESKATKDKIEIKDLLSDPIREKIAVKDLLVPTVEEKVETEAKSDESAEAQATFVRQAVPDGSAFPTGHVFYQAWTVKNPGPATWPSGCVVRYVGGDNMLNVDDTRPSSDIDVSRATESNIINRPIKPGEEVTFRVILRVPKRVGTAISYWRIKNAEGVPFGHRLWCHINVVEPGSDQSTSQWQNDLTRMGYHETFLRLFLEKQLAGNSESDRPTSGTTKTPQVGPELREALKRYRDQEARKISEARLKKLREELQEKAKGFQTLHSQSRQVSIKVSGPESSSSQAAAPNAEEVKKVAEAEVAALSANVPVQEESVEKPIEEPTETESSNKGKEPVTTRSAPIIPILATAPAESTEPIVSTEIQDDLFEDAESVNVDSESDGFVTDEEYDILDASDQEELSSK